MIRHLFNGTQLKDRLAYPVPQPLALSRSSSISLSSLSLSLSLFENCLLLLPPLLRAPTRHPQTSFQAGMDDYAREMMELKTLVTRTLEKKGVLAKIRVRTSHFFISPTPPLIRCLHHAPRI